MRISRKKTNTLKVPNSALRFRPSASAVKQTGVASSQPDKPQLYVLRSGQLKAVPAQFGLSDGKYTAIVSTELQPKKAHEMDSVSAHATRAVNRRE